MWLSHEDMWGHFEGWQRQCNSCQQNSSQFWGLFWNSKLWIVYDISKDPLHWHSDLTHGLVESLLFFCQGCSPCERTLQMQSVRIGRIPIYTQCLAIRGKWVLFKLLQETRHCKHSTVMPSAFNRAIQIRYQTIGGCHWLELKGMNPFVPIVDHPLISTRSTYWPNCAINETPTVIKCCPLIMNCISISF